MMSQRRKFVKDIGLVGVAQILTNVRGIAFLPILTKSLGAEPYGIWAQLLISLNFLFPVALLGTHTALVRFLPGIKEREEIQNQIWSTALITGALGSLIALLLVLFSRPIATLIEIPVQLIFLLGILVILQTLIWTLQSVFQALQEIGKLSFFLVVLPIGEVALATAAVFMGYGLFGAALSLILIRLIILVAMFVLIAVKVGLRFPAFSHLPEYLRFGVPNLASDLSFRFVQMSDTYLIAGFLGILFVAYYIPAYTFAAVLGLTTHVLGMLLPPLLAKLFADNNMEEVKFYLSRTLTYTLLLLIPAVFGLTILAPQLLSIFSTPEISAQASPIIPFIALSFLLYGVYAVMVQPLGLFKKTRIVGAVWVAAAILNIVLNIFVIPVFGILGAAATTLLTYIFICAAIWYFSFQCITFPIHWKTIAKSIAAAVLMSLALLLTSPEGLIQVLAAITLATLLYGVLLYAFRAISKEEIQFFSSFLKSSREV